MTAPAASAPPTPTSPTTPTTPTDPLDAVRRNATLASRAGFTFLATFAIAWAAASGLSFVLPREVAPWAYLLLGIPAAPVAVLLERRLGYVAPPSPDPLFGLAMQLLATQLVAFPAVMIVWDAAPDFVPVAFAAIVGGHFLPYAWLYRTNLYVALGVAVGVGPYLLAAVFGANAALHYTGFLVAAILAAGAVAAHAHAKRAWEAAGRP